MNFGKLSKNFDISKKALLKIYFTIGTILIVGLFVTYAEGFQKQASHEAKIVPDLISKFMYFAGHENFEAILVQYILEEIIANIDYPIIITNERQIPVFWKNLGISENANWNNLPPEQKVIAIRKLNNIRKRGHIIPLYHSEEDIVLGYTFYEDSKIIKRLKILPYVEVFFIVTFILFGLYGLSLVKRNEKKMIWVGLAKETAHQFGTPISSLIGWIDFLKIKLENNPQKDDLYEMLDDMTSDVLLLKKVASRFGKVGSNIKLKPSNIDIIINQSIEYFQKRLPHFNNEINIHFICKNENTMLLLDAELIQWAFENLIKNCIDAMKNKSGNIILTAFKYERKFYILFKDEGIGMSKSMFSKVFEPGITTKSRGWGLGLSLTKRIVEEFHNGKIKVLESTVGEGTTFEISLPLMEDDYSLMNSDKNIY